MTTKDKILTVASFISTATASLTQADIPTARLDTLILLEDVLGLNRANILAHPELVLTPTQEHKLNLLIEKRKRHTPLAYLRGNVMFYGRLFNVTTDTLVPRPETEDIITLLKTHLDNKDSQVVADIGTGSGCIGLTVLAELRRASVDLYDMSRKALAVAKRNALLLNVTPAHYYKEDLLSRASRRDYDAIVANLPYVPNDFKVNKDATFEPKVALFGGSDGLDKYRIFWRQLESFRAKPKYVLTESIPDTQHSTLAYLAQQAGYRFREANGFIQVFQVN